MFINIRNLLLDVVIAVIDLIDAVQVRLRNKHDTDRSSA